MRRYTSLLIAITVDPEKVAQFVAVPPSNVSSERHPVWVGRARAKAVTEVESLRITCRQRPRGNGREFGMCEDSFDHRFAEAEAALRGIDIEVGEVGAKRIVCDDAAEARLRSVGGIDAKTERVPECSDGQLSWTFSRPVGPRERPMHELHVDALAVVADDKSAWQDEDIRSQCLSSRNEAQSTPFSTIGHDMGHAEAAHVGEVHWRAGVYRHLANDLLDLHYGGSTSSA
jgi:hypothetical protein